MSASNGSPIQLTVRTASLGCGDVTVDCHKEWTVKELKKAIVDKHPFHPSVDEQKIIRGGKLLKDNEKLVDVLFECADGQMVHLVLSRPFSSPPDYHSSRAESPSQASPQPPDGLRHRTPQAYSTPPSYPPNYNGYWLHPAYFQQLAAAAAAAGYSPPPVPQQHGSPLTSQSPSSAANSDQSHSAPPPPAPPQDRPAAQQGPVQPNGGNQQPPANANAPANVMGAAGGEEDDDDEPLARDWLDKIYLLFRAGLLLSVFYFYSSSFRFGLAFVIMIVIFFYQAGWMRINRRGEQRPRENRNNNEPVNFLGGGGDNRQQQQGQEQQQQAEQRQQQEQPEEQQRVDRYLENQQGILATLFGFFTGFVTSLVPQNPADVVGN
eukprot:m.2339 g.2339  ORF g.2339 m.2339 type:complete len:378 (+) comp8588_c0_seq1:103-1236(+)